MNEKLQSTTTKKTELDKGASCSVIKQSDTAIISSYHVVIGGTIQLLLP